MYPKSWFMYPKPWFIYPKPWDNLCFDRECIILVPHLNYGPWDKK